MALGYSNARGGWLTATPAREEHKSAIARAFPGMGRGTSRRHDCNRPSLETERSEPNISFQLPFRYADAAGRASIFDSLLAPHPRRHR
jgi:hypothetical protein